MSEIQLSERIKMAHSIKVESAMRGKLALRVSWFDIKGGSHTQKYSLDEGSVIEF